MSTIRLEDDDDIQLQRSSSDYLEETKCLLPQILWKKAKNPGGPSRVHRYARRKDLERLLRLIEPFQEDPQLLDAHLKYLIPPLVDAFLSYVDLTSGTAATVETQDGLYPLSNAICRILYTFCKIRGEKVIVSFLNNEPRYLEPVLLFFESRAALKREDPSNSSLTWEEDYVLLLWLSHLMLAPFDLSNISASVGSTTSTDILSPEVVQSLPDIADRIFQRSLVHITSATKERDAAASLLVRLILRPDMRKIGLLDDITKWALDTWKHTDASALPEIHDCLGNLSFLSRLVASATTEEIGTYIPAIYATIQAIVNGDAFVAIRSSAVARKLVIKSFRIIMVHCLQSGTSIGTLDLDSTLEDVVDYLLQRLGDRDAPVRFAASKALSVVTLKLEPDMASSIIEAVLGSLDEDVLWHDSSRNLDAVNPLRWHGLVLTLAHLLYRKAVPADQLQDVINALLLALTFEQRTATGTSIGTNVRDAACYGIWALSRRYVTKELLMITTGNIKVSAQSGHQNLSVPQALATQLVVSACLDPAGNIRRGSSAALQELIGRHPDIIDSGISLVQAVDFHAVGLRQRAACEVATEAASLSRVYWDALFEGLLGWRGIGSSDVPSRLYSASAIAKLSDVQTAKILETMVLPMIEKFRLLAFRDIEPRHGLLMSFAALLTSLASSQLSASSLDEINSQIWGLMGTVQDFSFTGSRAELTCSAVLSLIAAVSAAELKMRGLRGKSQEIDIDVFNELLGKCLQRKDEGVLELTPPAVRNIVQLNESSNRICLVESWIEVLQDHLSYIGVKGDGQTMALGAACGLLDNLHEKEVDLQRRIPELLSARFHEKCIVEVRVLSLRSLRLILRDAAVASPIQRSFVAHHVHSALMQALNDYTITERGDVGSWARLEGLSVVEEAWSHCLLGDGDQLGELYATVTRLSVEKLDKVRTRAAGCLSTHDMKRDEGTITRDEDGVSTTTYFQNSLNVLSATNDRLCLALLEGYTSSAGTGSESVVRASRYALVDFLSQLPSYPSKLSEGELATQFSQSNILEFFVSILRFHLTNDRVLIPFLELLAFLFDMRAFTALYDRTNIPEGNEVFKWRSFLSLIQKAHFKSNNMAKLISALDVYRGLAEVEEVKPLVLKKIKEMCLHPYPKVRGKAMETLFVVWMDGESREGLKDIDSGKEVKDLRTVVERLTS